MHLAQEKDRSEEEGRETEGAPGLPHSSGQLRPSASVSSPLLALLFEISSLGAFWSLWRGSGDAVQRSCSTDQRCSCHAIYQWYATSAMCGRRTVHSATSVAPYRGFPSVPIAVRLSPWPGARKLLTFCSKDEVHADDWRLSGATQQSCSRHSTGGTS